MERVLHFSMGLSALQRSELYMVQGFIKNEDLLGPGPFLELEQAPAYVQEALQGLINSGTVKKPYVRALFRRAQEFRRINRHMYGVPMIDLVTDDEGSEPSVDGSVFDDQETAEQAAQDDWMQGAALEDILAQHPTPPVQLVAAPINPVHPAWAADEVVDLVSPPPSPLHTPAYNTVAAHASTAALLMQLEDQRQLDLLLHRHCVQWRTLMRKRPIRIQILLSLSCLRSMTPTGSLCVLLRGRAECISQVKCNLIKFFAVVLIPKP